MSDSCEHLVGLPNPSDVCEWRATWTRGNPEPVARECWQLAAVAYWVYRLPTGPVVPYSACEAHAEELSCELEDEGFACLTWGARL